MVCGRQIQWRKKWRNSWKQVKYCSRACRSAGLSDIDLKLEKVIVDLLRSRPANNSICPSEAARKLAASDDEDQWRPLLERTRRAARRLAHQGRINIFQGGQKVNPAKLRGPIRFKLNK